MYKLLIVSDSHGLTEALETIRDRHKEVDAAIHCGDSELQKESRFLEKYTVVKGNCDWGADFPDVSQMEVGGLKVVITHGHLYDVKSTMQSIQYLGIEQEADIVCFGHSHIAYAEETDNRLYLNPGSIRLPKRYKKASYAIVEWEVPEEVTVRFYEVDGTEITYFPYEKQYRL